MSYFMIQGSVFFDEKNGGDSFYFFFVFRDFVSNEGM